MWSFVISRPQTQANSPVPFVIHTVADSCLDHYRKGRKLDNKNWLHFTEEGMLVFMRMKMRERSLESPKTATKETARKPVGASQYKKVRILPVSETG